MIALGVTALAYQGITYTSRETIVDVGPFHATAEGWDLATLEAAALLNGP